MSIIDHIAAKLGKIEHRIVLETEIILVGPDETIAEDRFARPLTRETRETGGGEAANDHVNYRDLPLGRHHEEVLAVKEGCVCVRVSEARIK